MSTTQPPASGPAYAVSFDLLQPASPIAHREIERTVRDLATAQPGLLRLCAARRDSGLRIVTYWRNRRSSVAHWQDLEALLALNNDWQANLDLTTADPSSHQAGAKPAVYPCLTAGEHADRVRAGQRDRSPTRMP